jgi:hypothetical protein
MASYVWRNGQWVDKETETKPLAACMKKSKPSRPWNAAEQMERVILRLCREIDDQREKAAAIADGMADDLEADRPIKPITKQQVINGYRMIAKRIRKLK